jgi:hypothetical protein
VWAFYTYHAPFLGGFHEIHMKCIGACFGSCPSAAKSGGLLFAVLNLLGVKSLDLMSHDCFNFESHATSTCENGLKRCDKIGAELVRT